MPDTAFETLLARQLREYAEAGVRPIDRFAVAEATVAVGRTHGFADWLRRLAGNGDRRFVLFLVALLILVLAASLAVVGSRLLRAPMNPSPRTYRGEFAGLPDLSRPMACPLLVPLTDRRVLVIGRGSDGEDATTTGELYDPTTGTSDPLGPIPSRGGFVDWAIGLNDGRVLVMGDGSALIFDPTTRRFSPVGPMVTPRRAPAALLHDGRVLVAGGMAPGPGGPSGLLPAELFDPDTLTFSTTGSMSAEAASLATLSDGRVFVAPNVGADTARVYDPTTGAFSAAGRTLSAFPVTDAIALPDGRVVVFGSLGGVVRHSSHIEVWDPTSGTFSMAPGDRGAGLGLHDPPGRVLSATALDDGRVLLIDEGRFVLPAPGDSGADPSWSAIYDPVTGELSLTEAPRAWAPSVARLPDGRLLLVGGLRDGRTYLNTERGEVWQAPAVATVEIFQ